MPIKDTKYYQELKKIAHGVAVVTIVSESLLFLKPTENITVAQYAERNRYVTKAESSRPGMWDNSIVPFAVEIMDAATDPEVEEITMMGSAQVVKTEILKNILAYHIDHDPQKMLILEPTENVGRAFSLDKLKPMIDGNKRLREKIYDTETKDNNNTILHKIYPGGSLTIVGSNSPNSLAQRSVKLVISDDIDRIPPSAGEEGDPVRLAEERTESYSLIGYKHIRFSTPTIKGMSRVERLYELSDQRKYYVPCPECGVKQILKFENLQWEKETDLAGEPTIHLPETVKLACEACGSLISEKYKNKMVAEGEWIPKYPNRKHHRGYWINRLYSPFSSWVKIVKKFLESKDNPDEYQVFYNTYLALTWELETVLTIDESGLLERVEDYASDENPNLPNEILMLVAAVDVQPDRLELKIKGYGLTQNENLQSWLVYYDQIWGAPAQDDVWNNLDEILLKEFTREDGKKLLIKACFIDSGGHNTQDVYRFTQYKWRRNIFAIKGQAGFGRPMLLNKTIVGKKWGMTATLINLGVDTLKETVYSRLKVSDKKFNHFMHFSKKYCDYEYFKGITSERVVPKNGKMVWVKKSAHLRNEPLDLEAYCVAAFHFVTKGSKKYLMNLKEKLESQKVDQQEESDQQELLPVTAPIRKPLQHRRKRNFVNSWKGFN